MENLLTYEDLERIFKLSKKQLQGKVYSGFFVKGRDFIKIGREIRFYPDAIKSIISPKKTESAIKSKSNNIPTPRKASTSKRQKKPKGCLINFG